MWWTDAVIYEVYLQSFQDSDGDGIGDLPGLRRRLTYVQDLGVDCIWITPFYPSPQRDNGYDISDYLGVDPRFGSSSDLRGLIADAHNLGLRVVIDLVPNHSSSDHPWFIGAVQSNDRYRDYYIWKNAAAAGGPPNNWTSHFGGPAWTWDPASEQYWMHSFLPEQPDLNWRNAEVQTEFRNVIAYWLREGVDGFRIDVAQGLIKDERFRDNPQNPQAGSSGREYHQTLHVYDQNRPEVGGPDPGQWTRGYAAS